MYHHLQDVSDWDKVFLQSSKYFHHYFNPCKFGVELLQATREVLKYTDIFMLTVLLYFNPVFRENGESCLSNLKNSIILNSKQFKESFRENTKNIL